MAVAISSQRFPATKLTEGAAPDSPACTERLNSAKSAIIAPNFGIFWNWAKVRLCIMLLCLPVKRSLVFLI